jgi:hypothetical protein
MAETKPKKKPSKLVTCFKALYIVVMAFYGLYGLFLAIKAYTKFRDLSKGFNNIVENWREDIITDFSLVEPGANCPTGQEKEFKYNYGGAQAGCNCIGRATSELDSKIYTKPCNTTMTQAGCIEKPEVPGKLLDSINTGASPAGAKVLCTERKAGVDFISLSTNLQPDGTCKSGTVECGTSAATDPDRLNVMCVPSDIGCPVMDITSPAAAGAAGLSLTVGGTAHFVWTKVPSSTALPISELTLSTNAVCKNDNNSPKSIQNVGSYPLRRTGSGVQSSCEGGTDDTFIQFYSIPVENTLKINNAWGTDADLQASISGTETFNFYKRSYIELKAKCRPRAKEMEENDNEVDQMRNAQLGLLVIAGLVAIIIGFIIALMDACMLLHKNGICKMKEKNVKCIKNCSGKKKCIDLTLKIINAGFLVWAVIISAKTKTFFSDLASEDCFKNATNLLLKNFSQQVNDFVYKQNLNSLISFCIAMLVTLLKVCWSCYKKKQKKKNGGANKDMKPGQIVPINEKPAAAKPNPPQTPNASNMGYNPPIGAQPTPPMGMAPMGMAPNPPMGMAPPMQPAMQPVVMQPVVMQPVMVQQQPVVYR